VVAQFGAEPVGAERGADRRCPKCPGPRAHRRSEAAARIQRPANGEPRRLEGGAGHPGFELLRQSLTAAVGSEPEAPAVKTHSNPNGRSPPPSGPSRRGVWIAGAVAVIALLAAVRWFALNPSGKSADPAPPHPTEQPPPAPTGDSTPTTTPQASSSPASGKPLAVYTQIGAESDQGKYRALKASLPPDRYVVPAAEVVPGPIPHNDVRYCNPANEQDAKALAALMGAKGFNAPTVTKIGGCNPAKTLGNLEVWLQSGG
jgi:hypothetical protein